ncbi:hypothetical protein M2282_000640 [Variovorax boronicumulans]|nr:hypothetical protein [Variovorax boronicumulans]
MCSLSWSSGFREEPCSKNALAVLVRSSSMAAASVASAFNSLTLPSATRRRRDYTSPVDSHVRNLATRR